jgi:signal transduction histidine kinase
VLTVANDGPPVPAELVPKLFEPFRRARGERLDHGGGAGLGLTIARSIATAHDGLIEAVPRPEGGLFVSVSLPGAESAARQALPESSWTTASMSAESSSTGST